EIIRRDKAISNPDRDMDEQPQVSTWGILDNISTSPKGTALSSTPNGVEPNSPGRLCELPWVWRRRFSFNAESVVQVEAVHTSGFGRNPYRVDR
ncbi:MAG: hypothetical protein QF473_14440, partial [Planctomycetota bacterium]|nr:hypothetical protein [Planctomycetota bacterium]